MSNNCVISLIEPIIITKDDAQAWGGTWDPTYNVGLITLSEGNLRAVVGNNSARSSEVLNGGKHYFEILVNGWSNRYGPLIGVMGADESGYGGVNAYSYWVSEGQKYFGGVGTAFGPGVGPGERLGVLLDQEVGAIWFYKDGVVMNGGAAAFTGIPNQPMRAFVTAAGSAYTTDVTANFSGPFM